MLTLRDRTVMAILLGPASVLLVVAFVASPVFTGIAVGLTGWALVRFLNWRSALRFRTANASLPLPGRASGER
jgi:hypothetical protein